MEILKLITKNIIYSKQTMEYLNNKFDKNNKYEISKLINYLTKIRDDLENNSNGVEFLKFLKKKNKKKNKLGTIINGIKKIVVDKTKYYDHNEGWKTTTRSMKITIDLKNNIQLKFKFTHDYNGYDGSTNFWKYLDEVHENNKKLMLNEDYYEEGAKYHNGNKKQNSEKMKKEKKPMKNFQTQVKKYCKAHKLNFKNLSEKDIKAIMTECEKELVEHNKKIKEHNKKIKENRKKKNTDWTNLTNFILEKMNDEDEFTDLVDDMN